MEKQKLLVFDTNSVIHRAFHALPPLKDKQGSPSGAVYGSLLAFFSILSKVNPEYVVVAFDSPGKTFRHKKYKEYKATRPKAPDELIVQLKKTREVFSKMGVCVLFKEGLEADDIVGAVAKFAPENVETIIATGDQDILQLVNEKTNVYTLRRGVKDGVFYDKEKVEEKYEGISPQKIVDIKALQGDVSDNIPGVSGIGEKTAVKIIKKVGSLENLYKLLETEKEEISFISPKIQEKLKKEKEKAFLSKELATIDTGKFQEFNLTDFLFEKDSERVEETVRDLGFPSLLKRLGSNREKKERENNLKFNF